MADLAAPSSPESSLCAIVQNDLGETVTVPLPIDRGAISTHLLQAADDQGMVTLQLAFEGRRLPPVSLALPPCPRGEAVWVWIERVSSAQLRVELEHERTGIEVLLDLVE